MYTFIKPKRKVSRVFVHCSAHDGTGPAYEGQGLFKTITAWHIARKFNGCGYHLLIDKKGLIIPARNLEIVPAAQEGNNTGTIAICLHGLDINKFTTEQRLALQNVCAQINKAYNGFITFHGHCEVSKKSCPVIPYKIWLWLSSFGKMTR